MNEIKARLVSLLEENSDKPPVGNCLADLGSREARYGGRRELLDGRYALDLFRMRAKANEELLGGLIRGYDSLIPSLESAGEASVAIYPIEMHDRWYIVFTDESMSRLIGLLDSPKAKVAWFDPVKGYQ